KDSAGRKEVWISHSLSIEMDHVAVERDKAVLDALVVERNDLAHTFLTRWNTSSPESTQEALDYLEAQRARAIPVRDHLQSVWQALSEGRKEAAEHFMSDRGSREFALIWLQQTRIVQLFAQITETVARPDGWTNLARAGQLAHDIEADELERAKK